MSWLLRGSLCALTFALASGFDWPGRAERLVSTLTSAATPRERKDTLQRLSELAVPLSSRELEQLLESGDAELRAEALWALRRSFPNQERLLAATLDPAPEVRLVAISALSERSAHSQLTTLLRAASDLDPRVRAASRRALSTQAHDGALAALTAGLSDPALEVRIVAAQGLATRSEPAARALLLRAFDAALPELRAAILDALGNELASRGSLTLEVALDDADEQVVLAALRGYARSSKELPRTRIAALLASPSPQIAAAAARLLAAERPAVEPAAQPAPWLAPLERTAQRTLSPAESTSTLAELEGTLPVGEARASDALLEWLGHAPTALQRRIVALVERCGGQVAARRVLPLLESADPSLRAPLLRLLARSTEALATDTLERALDDEDEELRGAAASALADKLDARLLAALASRLGEASATRRLTLLRLLAIGLPRSSARLPARLGERLCGALHESDANALHASLALRALGGIDHPCARQAVREALAEPRAAVRIAALRASARDRGLAARTLRRALIDHDDPRIAASALTAAALARDPLPSAWLRSHRDRAVWPLGSVVAFAIAAPRHASALSDDELCTLSLSGEPATRSNALVALSRRDARGCSQRAEALLAQSSAWPLRRAAAWSIASTRSAEASTARAALAHCLQHERDARVRAACAGEQTPVSAAPPASQPRALVLPDARVLISWPDGSGDVAWPGLDVIASLPAWFAHYGSE